MGPSRARVSQVKARLEQMSCGKRYLTVLIKSKKFRREEGEGKRGGKRRGRGKERGGYRQNEESHYLTGPCVLLQGL